ncbi:hypothetical protein EGH22_17825 [Halomicroarcula sp. F28]|uniref:GIDE domain-containing protein n=1 Tax=Haloarcula salinisoli TaxID=2487746 RepID=UPI001C72ECAA|nr:GIDE domain-containing protein [Halomicroarcula salinisoli]MBX0288192.1 hypothetical protein [Halomicroarcula salinisoli]
MVDGLATVALADLTQLVLQSNNDGSFFPLALFAGGLYAVYNGFDSWKQMRLIQDTATEKVRSAAAGRTELEGTGKVLSEPVERPFGEADCLVAKYRIEEWRHDNTNDTEDWETIDSETRYDDFQVDDGTGTMRVEPDGSTDFKFDDTHSRQLKVDSNDEEPPEIIEFMEQSDDVAVPDRDGVTGSLFSAKRRYTEKWIPVEDELYLLGGAEPVEPDETTSSGLVLREDDASEEFIVSQKGEEDIVSDTKWKAPAKMAGGVAASAVGLFFLLGGL